MNADDIWGLVFLADVVALFILRIRWRGEKRVYITDYQRGVRFDKGTFARVLDPGCYKSRGSRQQITMLDMRPQPFVVERLFYKDALQASAVISIGAELKVIDPQLVATKLKDQTKDSISIVRDALRLVASKTIVDVATEARSNTAREIEAAANVDLANLGMIVSDMEITEAWSVPVEPRMTAGAN